MVSVCHGYEILVYHDLGTKSHLMQLYPIVEKLLDSGHKVIVYKERLGH